MFRKKIILQDLLKRHAGKNGYDELEELVESIRTLNENMLSSYSDSSLKSQKKCRKEIMQLAGYLLENINMDERLLDGEHPLMTDVKQLQKTVEHFDAILKDPSLLEATKSANKELTANIFTHFGQIETKLSIRKKDNKLNKLWGGVLIALGICLIPLSGVAGVGAGVATAATVVGIPVAPIAVGLTVGGIGALAVFLIQKGYDLITKNDHLEKHYEIGQTIKNLTMYQKRSA